jgi:hypothetical protein
MVCRKGPEMMIEEKRNNARYYYQLGRVHLKLGNIEEAQRELT